MQLRTCREYRPLVSDLVHNSNSITGNNEDGINEEDEEVLEVVIEVDKMGSIFIRWMVLTFLLKCGLNSYITNKL